MIWLRALDWKKCGDSWSEINIHASERQRVLRCLPDYRRFPPVVLPIKLTN
jgi:hypothetical protein